MSEIGVELLEAVRGKFDALRLADSELSTAYRLIRQGKADYRAVNRYAIRLGELLSQSLLGSLTEDALPGKSFYLELAQELLGPLLAGNYEMVSAAAMTAQTALNRAAGLGLNAVKPALNLDRVEGLAKKVSSYETYSEARWLFEEPIVNFTQAVVDDAIEANVSAHAKAGLSPVVRRIAVGGCCEWCRELAGEHKYPVLREVYQRHERCRCIVLYDPKEGKVQDVHSRIQYASVERALRDERIARVKAAEERLRENGKK